MIPRGVDIFVGLEPIDLRWGFDRLAGVAQERVGREARCRALFVFFGKRRASIKNKCQERHDNSGDQNGNHQGSIALSGLRTRNQSNRLRNAGLRISVF